MRGFAVVAILALTLAFLAGCTGDAASEEPTEIIVKSQPKDVFSDEESETETKEVREPGIILGVVVDAAIRPIPTARVSIPGLNLEDDTDREGVFAFPDLAPSVYFMKVTAPGYEPAETEVELEPAGQVRIRFVLDAIPPPDPYHVTKPYTGFADFTNPNTFGFGVGCSGCTFPFDADPLASAYVIEAVMNPYDWQNTAGNNSFQIQLYSGSTGTVLYENGPNPYLSNISPAQVGNETRRYQLEVTPLGFPLPESNKKFQVFVTTWYNSMPPAGWSFVNGDP